MKFTRYSKWEGSDWDGISLEDLLSRLADFLLQSGFEGDSYYYSGWDDTDGEQTLDNLREAIMRALTEEDLLSETEWEALADENGNLRAEAMAALLDRLIERLVAEGYINLSEAESQSRNQTRRPGPGKAVRQAERSVRFELTDK